MVKLDGNTLTENYEVELLISWLILLFKRNLKKKRVNLPSASNRSSVAAKKGEDL